jgi:hypothetical protein
MFNAPTTAQGPQLIAYLTGQQAQWLDQQLSKAQIQFRIDRAQNGFVIFTTEAARPYLDRVFGVAQQQQGGRDFGPLLRLAMILAPLALGLYGVVSMGLASKAQGMLGVAQFFGMKAGPLWAVALFAIGIAGWYVLHFVLGRKAALGGTVLWFLVLGGAAILVARMGL